jgi:hypothetical protein
MTCQAVIWPGILTPPIYCDNEALPGTAFCEGHADRMRRPLTEDRP